MRCLVERYHDISSGHRVVGHEGKCVHLHGHNYRIHFFCELSGPEALDSVGRVVDFGVIKDRLCRWLEDHWDHGFLVWDADPLLPALVEIDPQGIVIVPFNPTAELMARHLVEVVGPTVLAGTEVVLCRCRVEETRKCSAVYVRMDV